jgi:hypothetical protein
MCNWIRGLRTCKILTDVLRTLVDIVYRWLFCTEGPPSVESGHNQYNPKTGTKLNGASFDINYGSGFAKGDVYMDQVTLGGITTNQAIECATSVDSSDISDHQLDGVLGVGFNSGSSKVNNGYPQPSSATQSPLNSGKIPLLLTTALNCSWISGCKMIVLIS